jgi:hypothetical protein
MCICAWAAGGESRLIHGTVVDAAGKPVAGAEVLCSPGIPRRFEELTVHTGPDGAFTMGREKVTATKFDKGGVFW